MITDQKIKLFGAYLKTKSLKLTWERETILKRIIERDGHFTSENLIKFFESSGNERISRATVYRTLKLLEEAAIINSFHVNEESKTYEKIKAHHDHMICNECGKLIEFCDTRLETLQQLICKEHGFEADYHIMNITGKCRDCQKKE